MSIANQFGAESANDKIVREVSEGYLAGIDYARQIQELITAEHKDKSQDFRYGLFLALEENFS